MNILSFDGGGIRGVLSVRLLQRLVEKYDVVGKADVIAGTSTGGIIALALAAGLTPSDILEWYVAQGPIIFSQSLARKAGELFGARYPTAPLAGALAKVMPLQLKDLKKRVIIPTFRLSGLRWQPYTFDSTDPASRLLDCLGVALATSAAPTYFPTARLSTEGGFCDGGVWANDPSMEALTLVPEPWGTKCLSIGTGLTQESIPEAAQRPLDWGLVEWAMPLVDLLLAGPQEAVSVQMARLIGANYLRVNPAIPTIALDDAGQIGNLIKLADATDLTQASVFLSQW